MDGGKALRYYTGLSGQLDMLTTEEVNPVSLRTVLNLVNQAILVVRL